VKKIINRLLLLSLAILVGILIFTDIPLLSPFTENELSSFLLKKTSTQKKIYGFLPYWNINKVTLQEELTHLAYFSLSINSDGSFKTHQGSNLEPGFNKLQSGKFSELIEPIDNSKIKTNIVLSLFSNKDIKLFLASEEAQAKFLNSLDSLLLAHPFSGVNIDIEYDGEASQELRDQYTEFIKKTSLHLQSKYKNMELSVDMYAAAASKNMIWDVSEIHPFVSYIIVMAYDFHRSSSAQAGPVAPLFNKENSWKESIHSYLKDFAKKVPTKKILLGIPFYGYEWQTTTREPQSFTYPQSGSTASYQRIKELLEKKSELKIQEHWDKNALEPYLTYEEDNKIFTVYYENAESITYKLDYVNQLNLAGIAIWSLGYEGNSRDLWDVIQQSLLHEPTTNSIVQ
jgi:spore germination protein YaaH